MKNDFNYIVIDLETTIRNRGLDAIGKLKASPYHPDNKIVMIGTSMFGHIDIFCAPPEINFTHTLEYIINRCIKKNDLVIGQNIGFDLLYVRRYISEELYTQFITECNIWDTMLAEYILTGQDEKFISLDKLATKYGGTLKPNEIKDFWDNGVDTDMIPEDKLKEYLVGDVANTELVALAQIEKAIKQNKFNLIIDMMTSRLATLEMEWNGMVYASEDAAIHCGTLRRQRDSLQDSIVTQIGFVLQDTDMAIDQINVDSNQQLSAVLFGGPITYTTEEEVLSEDGTPVFYKTGKRAGEVKTRKVKVTDEIDGLSLSKIHTIETKKKGIYKVDDSVLKNFIHIDLVADMLEYRKINKDIKYYINLNDLCWPDTVNTGIIHPNFNHCATDTGRLSSSNPNMQNLTNKD